MILTIAKINWITKFNLMSIKFQEGKLSNKHEQMS